MSHHLRLGGSLENGVLEAEQTCFARFSRIFPPEVIQVWRVHHEINNSDHLQLVALPAVNPVPLVKAFRVVVLMSSDHELSSVF